MMKKIAFFIVSLTISSMTLWGQSFQLKLSTNNQQVVEKAVKDAFCILRQEFQLQDTTTGNKYNLDSLAYFGYAESLCIKVKGGYVADKALTEPWKEDANVADYPKYRPVLSSSRIYDSALGEWVKVRRQSFGNYCTIGNSDKIYVADSLFNNGGLLIDEEYEGKEGWLLWVYSQDGQLSFQSFRQKLSDIGPVDVWDAPEQLPGKKLRGGMIMSADYSVIGEISFKVVALMVDKIDGWHAEPLKDCFKNQSKEEHRLVEVLEPRVIIDSDKVSVDNASKKKQKKTTRK